MNLSISQFKCSLYFISFSSKLQIKILYKKNNQLFEIFSKDQPLPHRTATTKKDKLPLPHRYRHST